jgi:hypothetical protein
MTLMNPTPSVEWMPLDGLAADWAAFASCSTREHAFAAARLAFTALEEETAARRLEEEAQGEARSMGQGLLSCAFERLQASARSWLLACERLDQYARLDLPHEEEQREAAVRELAAESYQHLLSVACLSVRLVQELHTVLDTPVRVLLGHVPAQEVS